MPRPAETHPNQGRTARTRPSRRTILVTGATSQLGRALVADLRARGDDVIALSDDPTRAQRLLGADIHAIATLDIIDPDVRIHAIINLAGARLGARRWTKPRKRLLIQSRLRPTRAVVELIGRLRHKPAVLVSESTVAIYGDGGDAALVEASPAAPGAFAAELCKMWEATAGQAELHGVRTVRLRFGPVLGQPGASFPILSWSDRLGVVPRFGQGEQWAAWIHQADAIGLIHHAMRTEALNGPVNAVAPTPVRHRQLVAARASRCLTLPLPAGLMRAGLGEVSQLALASQRVIARKALDSGYRFEFPTLAEAAADLNATLLNPKETRHA